LLFSQQEVSTGNIPLRRVEFAEDSVFLSSSQSSNLNQGGLGRSDDFARRGFDWVFFFADAMLPSDVVIIF